MARNKVIQVACPPELYSKVQDYKDTKSLTSDAEALRELALFALRILEHSDNDDGLSTRELLESILKYTVKGFYQDSMVYYQTFDEDRLSGDLSRHRSHRQLNQDKAGVKIESILAGEDKED